MLPSKIKREPLEQIELSSMYLPPKPLEVPVGFEEAEWRTLTAVIITAHYHIRC